MIEATCKDYSEFIDLELNNKLEPINQSVDDMLTRLEEFETMVLLIQQERCNSIGITGSLTNCIDIQPQLHELCQRIDTLENLTEYLKSYINHLDTKICTLEEKMGFAENTNKFTNFLKSSIFKKTSDSREVKQTDNSITELPDITVQSYFVSEEI